MFADLGDVGDTRTRWADWIDLLTPYVVTGAAAGALRGGGASRGTWTLFWFATVLYTQGQGIHLAANSINNAVAGDAEPAYLWDEHVGHYLWYVGFYLVVVALAVALADRRPRGGLGAHLLALLVGFTTFTNSVEGQTPWLGIGASVVFAVLGAADPGRHGPAAADRLRASPACCSSCSASGRAASPSSPSSAGSRPSVEWRVPTGSAAQDLSERATGRRVRGGARRGRWPSARRSRDATISASASVRPTQLAPSTDLPGSRSL